MANRENIRKWVDALRSGQYEQGQGHLRVDDRYCCLGVACELAVQDGLNIERQVADYHCTHDPEEDGHDAPHDGSIFQYDSESGTLPPAVSEWLGVGSGVPAVATEAGYELLSELNDMRRLDFDTIADLIEKEWLSKEADDAE